MKGFAALIEFLLPLLEHNLLLSDSLHILSEDGNKDAAFIEESMKKGRTFALSVGGRFKEKAVRKYLYLLQAAEETGLIKDAVRKIHSLIKKESGSRKNLTGIMLYPAGIIILSICATAALLIKGIPLFASYGAVTESDISSIVRSVLSAMFLLLAMAAAFSAVLYRTYNPRHKLSSLFYYLYLFTSSGIPLHKALSRTLPFFDDLKLKKALLSIKENIGKGVSVPAAFRQADFFSGTVLSWISIAEHQGEIETTFLFLSSYYEEIEADKIRKAERISEPASLIITACYLAYLIQGSVVPLLTSFGGL